MTFSSIAVLGAGAWGTALAVTSHQAGRSVKLWAREPQVADDLRSGRGNPTFLPGIDLPPIPAFSSLSEAVDGADAILSVVPSQFARSVLEELSGTLPSGIPIALCSKGIEQSTLKLQTEVLADTVPQAAPAVLSGPSFAADVAKNLPTAVTLACADKTVGEAWMQAIGQPTFRPYWSDDLIGAEIGGAVKNVLAIACGTVEGLQLGKSAHAALISRGFAEMTRLGVAMGGRAETLAGLCGLGDLVLTCSSTQSRNMSFGKSLGEGQSVQDILSQRTAVTEGVATAPGVVELAHRHKVEMPICEAVNSVLSGQQSVQSAMIQLLDRPFREER